ncbi:VG15 protein [Nocardia puris]|uniref:VG15 protein n=1 Tax=Nocardia puris TaxID=208602 RepID=UPI002E208DA1
MLSAILRALHAALGAALARVILRRMRTDGVPITPDRQAQMARRLHREVVAARRQSYRRTVAEIRRFDRSLTPAPIQPYPIEAVQAAIERAVAPPPPRRRPSRPAPLLNEGVRPSGEPSTEPDPRVRVSGPEPPAPTGDSSRATVTAPEGTPRRAVVDAPEVERPRSGVVTTADIDPVTRTRVRASVSAPTLENRTDPRVIARVSESLTATLTRHVAAASRTAIEQTADNAGEEIGWARVLSGTENCPWCAMLASRGPVYKSDKSAGYVVGQGRDSAGPRRGRGGRRRQGDGTRGNQALGQPYHDNCDCEVVLVRRGQPWEGQTEHEWLDSLWTLTSNAAEATGDSLEQIWSRAYRRIQKEPDLYDELMDLWQTSTAGLSGSAALRAYRAAVKENTPAALAAARRPRRATSDE